MCRATTVIGSLTAATALALTLTGPAWAAQGQLFINGVEHEDPSGCYRVPAGEVEILNLTDTDIHAFRGTNCNGTPLGEIQPGVPNNNSFIRSVYVP